MPTVAKLVLKLGVEAGDLGPLRDFETMAKKSGVAATGVAKGTKVAGRSVRDLTGNVKDAGKALSTARIGILAFAAGLTALTKIASNAAAGFRRFELNTGLSAQKLQEWQQQAALSGVTADEMASSLSGLQQAAQEIAMGHGDRQPWAWLGLQPGTDPFVVLDQLEARLKSVPTAMGTMMAGKLGLSDTMVAFLRERATLGDSDKSLILSKDEIDRLKMFNIYFNRVWDDVKRMGSKVGALLAPIAHAVMWTFERFAKSGVIISKWFGMLKDKFGSGPLKAAMAGILAVLFPTTTAIFLLIAALDDLAVYFNGGDSLFGRIIGYFHNWKRVAQDIVINIATILSMLSSGAAKIMDFLHPKADGTDHAAFDWGDVVFKMAEKLGAFDNYADSQVAMVKDGKRVYRDQNNMGGDTTVHNTFNVDGSKDPRASAQEMYNQFKRATSLTGPLQGSPQTAPAGGFVKGMP